MRLSTKGRFAVNAMIDIALREALAPVSLTDIASAPTDLAVLP